MQFLIIARDGKDQGALERRMEVRPRHLENIDKVKDAGHVIAAGGIIGENTKTVGSYLLMEYNSREQLDDFLKNEPYVIGNVWQDITVEVVNTVLFRDPLDTIQSIH